MTQPRTHPVQPAREPQSASPARRARGGGVPWVALALATAVLLPFLGKAFTIDDPVFLREAQHLLQDPLRPSAFRMVWATERNLRASEFLPGGPMAAYLLVPLALARWQEWAGHLLELVYFALAIVGTASLARRFGLTPWSQRSAALLTASAPAALGMAGTLMPDIAAMTLAVFGVERLLAWMQDHRTRDGMASAALLAAAVLARINLLVLLAVLGYAALRRSWMRRERWDNVVPLVVAGTLVLVGMIVTRDADAGGGSVLRAIGHQLGLDFLARHTVAVAIAYLTTTPLLVALLTRRGLEPSPLLWVWLLVPLPVIAYVQVAPKYLLPALPAAAILAAYGLDRVRVRREIVTLLAGAGAALGFLILRADARMSGAAKEAAAVLIEPRVQAGDRVWYVGHWGFHWYAEGAGARPLTSDPPFPSQGDIVVSSNMDRPVGMLQRLPRTLLATWGSSEASGQVMSRHAGFYSDLWGLLPWWWEAPVGPRFQVWRVTR